MKIIYLCEVKDDSGKWEMGYYIRYPNDNTVVLKQKEVVKALVLGRVYRREEFPKRWFAHGAWYAPLNSHFSGDRVQLGPL
jgi:hypothetical protein